MKSLSLYELLALKQLESGPKSSIQIIRAVDNALEITIEMGAKYAAVRRLIESGLSELVDNTDIAGKVSEITAEGRDGLEEIRKALSSSPSPDDAWVLIYYLDGVRRVIHRPTAKECLDCFEELEPFAIAKGAFVKSYPLACRQLSDIENMGQFVADDWVLEKK